MLPVDTPIYGMSIDTTPSNCLIERFVKILLLPARLIFVALFVLLGCDSTIHDEKLETKESVGKALFFDTSLSSPSGQSCATCHNPDFAFSDAGRVVSDGAVTGIKGMRNTPSLLYMGFSPELYFDSLDGTFVGGQFWDGRSMNFSAQALVPLLSSREMNNSSKEEVVKKVQEGRFAQEFKFVYGEEIFADTEKAFNAIGDAIASFELSESFAPFTSKYDYFLARKTELTEQELRGLSLYNDPNKGNCAACHPSSPSDGPPLFTDFTYDNLGIPKNPRNPFYSQPRSNNKDGAAFVDVGLGVTTGRAEDLGKMKVPTLRNIEITAPYFHNGAITSLTEAVQFYNKRDLGIFGDPEVLQNVNKDELGNLKLTDTEVEDIVSFLKTLTDGYQQ